MPRHRRIIQSQYPYHVTLRAANRVKFNVDFDEFWPFVCDQLLFSSWAFKVEIQAFVLMTNHYHMLVRTPDANLPEFMRFLNLQIGNEIGRRSGLINYRFGARYYSTLIEDLKYYSQAYRYVYRNPVQANLSVRVQDYPYSSIQFVLGRDKCRFPIFDTYFDSIEYFDANLNWLNTEYESEKKYLELKKAMKSPIFQVPATVKNQR